MKKIILKIGCFFWSWGFLKFILWTATLIILFYAEEDWRGARAWAATKAEWEAKGETFDFNKLLPPPIPDSQNLAAIPLFKMEPDPESQGGLEPLALQRALRRDLPSWKLPSRGDWQVGHLPDMKKIRAGVAAVYAEVFKAPPPTQDALKQMDALYPFVADLREASATRRYCDFSQDYHLGYPYDLFASLITAQIKLSQILTLHAILALDDGRPDLALEDIKVNFKLISGLRRQPLRVSHLVAIGMNAIGTSAIYDGIYRRAWNDIQLADLQSELRSLDFLSDYPRVVRGECIGMNLPGDDQMKGDRTRLKTNFKEIRQYAPERPLPVFPPDLWPDGWFDEMKVQWVAFDLSAVDFVDLKIRTVSPSIFDRLTAEISRRQNRWDARAPWNMLFSGGGAESVTAEMPTYAKVQVWVDETGLACALERYHLAQGTYPSTLDALIPAYAVQLPHDIFNGQPYQYRLQSDGTFLLYSIGWNQKDDGGKLSPKAGPHWSDLKQGDWVWAVPKATP